jgi:Prophage CP4-57 regulatory protein (AlpA)
MHCAPAGVWQPARLMEAVGQFPQRIKLGLGAVGWMGSEVQARLTMHAKAREAARSYAMTAE